MDFDILNGKKIFFVGGGNMAGALIDGLLKAKTAQNLDIHIGVSDKNEPKRAAFIAKGVNAVSPEQAGELMADSDVVVLAVKPQVMATVCEGIRAFLGSALVVSVAAGLTIDGLTAMTGSTRIVRTMPNLPATVGFGAAGLYAKADEISETDKALAMAVMAASGVAVWVDNEADLHTVTAVAGSAPAYFFYVLEQMVAKACELGLPAESAKALAVQTMHGAALMANEVAADGLGELRAKVTSKGGTTHAAITSMQNHEVGTHIHAAMQACFDRSVALGK